MVERVTPVNEPAENATLLVFTVDGVEYVYDPEMVEDDHERALWIEARLREADLWAAAKDVDQANTPRFVIAGFIFLARLQAGHDVTYRQVVASMRRGQSYDVTVENVGDHPEVPAAD